MASSPDSRLERRVRQNAQRMRRRRLLAASAAALLAVSVGAAALSRGHKQTRAGTRLRHDVSATQGSGATQTLPGDLLIADRGNNRMLLVDARKHVLWRYPRPGQSLAMPFRFDDDAFFGAGFTKVISNQEEQHTIQVISFPGGRLLWRYGHVDSRGSAPGYLNTPDDAYLLQNGLVTVADAYNCRILFISPAGRIVRQLGSAGTCSHAPPRSFGPVNGGTPLRDGGILISEIPGSWIDNIGPRGRLRWAVQAPISYPSDPQLVGSDRVLVADYARPGQVIVMTTRGRVVWRYGPRSGPGELDHPSLAVRVSKDLIAVNDDYRDRVVLIDLRLRRIVWQYGHTGLPGRAPGYLNTPDGLDLLPFAASRLPALQALLSRTGTR
jgi:hypothetical protein